MTPGILSWLPWTSSHTCACHLNCKAIHIGSDGAAKGPSRDCFSRDFAAVRAHRSHRPRGLQYFVHIFNQIDVALVRSNDSPAGNPVTRSVRAAALRSTALATGLAFAMGLVLATEVWAKPKVPLPKPRPIARNVVPNTTASLATNAAAKSSAPKSSAPIA